eukprot:3546065-Pyramimonas_sp.AAC.1
MLRGGGGDGIERGASGAVNLQACQRASCSSKGGIPLVRTGQIQRRRSTLRRWRCLQARPVHARARATMRAAHHSRVLVRFDACPLVHGVQVALAELSEDKVARRDFGHLVSTGQESIGHHETTGFLVHTLKIPEPETQYIQ